MAGQTAGPPDATASMAVPHSAAQLQARQQAYLRSESDASGTPRPDLYRQGIAAQQHMSVSGSAPKAAIKLLPPGVTGVQWTQIGPAPLRIDASQNFQGAGPDSGEVVDIAVDPTGGSDNTIYIATNDGGIWKTTDGGTTWRPRSDYMPSLSMGAVVLDPSNPSIVYAGTGNNFDGGGVFSKGVGIYKSLDGGDTWTVLNPGGIFTGVAIVRMVMPASGTLLVATASGLFKSVDGGAHFGSNATAFDNGASVLAGYITDLHLDTATGTTIYAGRNGAGLMRSTDSGTTFPTNIFDANIPGHSFFTFSQSTSPDANTIYANLATGGTPPAQIWRTDQRHGDQPRVGPGHGGFEHVQRGRDGQLSVRLRPDHRRRPGQQADRLHRLPEAVRLDRRWRLVQPGVGQQDPLGRARHHLQPERWRPTAGLRGK